MGKNKQVQFNKVSSVEISKDEMIYYISHDLKTPVSVIKSYAEAIQDGIFPKGDLNASLETIIKSTERLESKINQILALKRIDVVLNHPTDVHVEVATIIKDVIDSMKLIRKDISIEYKMDNSSFFMDEESLRTMIENLLSNALRYAKTVISICVENETISIYNDGNHIPESIFNELTVPFVKGEDGHSGLGLAIVDRISQSFGYHLTPRNIDNGVLFTIKKNKH